VLVSSTEAGRSAASVSTSLDHQRSAPISAPRVMEGGRVG
jgi:hypothetical protein